MILRNGQFVANDDGEANCGASKYFGTFAPGQTKTFTLTWNGRNYRRDVRTEWIPPEVYTVKPQLRVEQIGKVKVKSSLANGTVPFVGTAPLSFIIF
jgi:hypothetical protein